MLERAAMTPPGLMLALWLSATPAPAQTPGEGSRPEQAVRDGFDVAEVVVIARRPGRDPSGATTECVWSRLPPDQREALSRRAGAAVATLADHDTVPLTTPVLTDEAVASALAACGGSGGAEHLPFARVALAAFAVEKAALTALARDKVPEARLMRGWSLLSPEQMDVMLTTAANPDEEPGDLGLLMSAVFKAVRAVRPMSAWNPLEYRNGTTTHRIVFFYEAHAARRAMERRF